MGAASSNFGYRHKSRQIYCPADSLPKDEMNSPTTATGVVAGIGRGGRSSLRHVGKNVNDGQNKGIGKHQGKNIKGGIIGNNIKADDHDVVVPAANFMSSSHLLKQQQQQQQLLQLQQQQSASSSLSFSTPQPLSSPSSASADLPSLAGEDKRKALLQGIPLGRPASSPAASSRVLSS
eukprot:GILI01006992.1.p1 GENE.GILI01006992.1~~GILI01006992.1.p1  ORF type:complete len:188 (+),score=56.85 GILI01006992.1:32-565(+)